MSASECLPRPCRSVWELYVSVCNSNLSLTARYSRGKPHPRSTGVSHQRRLLNYPWVDLRPAKGLGAHTLYSGEYLLKSHKLWQV